MVSAAPVGNEPVSDEELRPHILEGFIGQPRLKAQLQAFPQMPLENVTFLSRPYPACGASGQLSAKPLWP